MTKINEELVSAYLDGELTADEQVRVEQALATDARLRRLHDDMRALRHSLQAMPPQKLDVNFAARVLRAVEQAQVHASKPHHDEPEIIIASHHGSQTTVSPAQHEPMSLRVMIWSVAALAAAVVFVLMMPDQTAQIANRVAMNDQPPAAKPAVPAEKDLDTKTRVDELTRSAPENEIAAPTRDAAAPPMADKASEQPEKAKSFAAKDEQTNGAIAKKQATNDGLKEKHGPREELGSAQPMRGAGGGRSFGNAGEKAQLAAPKAAAMAEQRDSGERSLKVLADQDNDQLLVVRLRVAPEALSKRGIDQILAEQQIDVQPAEAGQALAQDLREAGKLQKESGNRLEERQRNVDRDDRAEFRKQVDQLAKASPNADVIYVEATREQIEAAIAVLELQTDQQLKLTMVDDAQTRLRRAADGDPADKGLRRNTYAADAASEPRGKAGEQKPEEKSGGKPEAAANADAGFDRPPLTEAESLARPRRSFAQRLTPSAATASGAVAGGAPPPAPAAVAADSLQADRKADAASSVAEQASEGIAKPGTAVTQKSLKREQNQQRVRVLFVIEASPPE